MRRLVASLLFVFVILPVAAQQPVVIEGGNFERFTGKGPGGGGGRMMMMGGSPDEMFDRFAKGKNVIRRDDLDPMMQRGFDWMARQLNITNGEITREQAKQFAEQMQGRMRGGEGNGNSFNGEGMDRRLEERFRGYDRNNDGLLDANEMSDGLKAERDKWDTNKDGFIDLNEYKAYARARMGDRGDRPNGQPEAPANPQQPSVAQTPNSTDVDSDAHRPVVFRFGFLPKELPDWFASADIDFDGQISLYEWVKAGKPVEKFREMDTNDDDLVTAEEVLRFQNGGKIQNYNIASALNSDNRQPAYRFNNQNGNERRGPGGRGPGGGNWMGGGNGNNNGGNRGGNGADRMNAWRDWMNNGGFGGDRTRSFGNGNDNGNRGEKGGDRPRGPGGMEKGKRGEKGGNRDRNNNSNGGNGN